MITKIECANCGKEVVRPELEGVEHSEDCPHCGQNLHKTTQATLDEVIDEEE